PVTSQAAVQRPAPLLGQADFEADEEENLSASYRALSTAAVAALVLGALSVLAMLDWSLAVIPLAAVILGVVALRKIRRQPQEYTGRGIAIVGIALGILFGAGGMGYLEYVRIHEVPTGYNPIDYSLLQPRPDDPPNFIPPEAKELDGKKIFIKGYIYPGLRK